MESVCKFVKTKAVLENTNILHFVYEREATFAPSFLLPAAHTIYLVTQGYGVLHTTTGTFPLQVGDLFFTFSAKPYYIESTGPLQYLYIGFIGLRVPGLLDRLHVTPLSPVYSGYSSLLERWFADFERATSENLDLLCESLLLYTLSFLCTSSEEKQKKTNQNGVLGIKQYVDLHYTDATLNLKTVSEQFHYNPNYVSSAFLKLTRLTFSKYLCNLRMEHAKTLLASGITGIKEVATAAGFSDALYFSKVFRKRFGMAPKHFTQNSSAEC